MELSEYEAKRQRRIEANQHKLKALNISKPQQQPRITRKKREIEPLQPTRRSIRQRQLKENVQEEIETEELLEIQPLPRPKRVKTEPLELLDVPITELSVSYKGKKQHLSSSKIEIQFQEFHERYLGTQVFPVGKNTVMQGLCPAGYVAKFSKMSGVQPWKNAVALFVNVESDSPYDNVFHQETEEGETTVHFQWFGQNRWHDESPLVVRLRGMERGLESLRFHESYYDKKEGEEPLLLFIRHTQGPYIYCGRLGYLGYKPESKPLEFRWQLLDVDSLQWEKIRGLLDRFPPNSKALPTLLNSSTNSSSLALLTALCISTSNASFKPTSILGLLPTKLQGSPHVAQCINQFLLPSAIDAAVYLNLQRVITVFGATSTWTAGAMDGAAARGRLELVKWLDTNRSEGCSSAAFNGAAANNHLDVLLWLLERYADQYDLTEALRKATEAGQMEAVVMKVPRCEPFAVGEALGVAIVNEHTDVVEFLLQNCSSFEMGPGLVAAADNDFPEMLEHILTKCGSYDGLSFRGKIGFRSCFVSAASRGSAQIVKLLVSGIPGSGFPLQTIGSVLVVAAASSNYELCNEQTPHHPMYQPTPPPSHHRCCRISRFPAHCKSLWRDECVGCGGNGQRCYTWRLKLVKWVDTHRSEGCSSAAFNGAAANNRLVAVAACVNGLAQNEDAVHVSTVSGRNLKGSVMAAAEIDIEDEERGVGTKVAEFFKKQSASISKFFGTGTTSQVETLGKNTKLVKGIQNDARLSGLKTAVQKNPGAATKNVGKIGEFVARLKKIKFEGDVKGMRIAYGILFLMICGILVSGVVITRNVQNTKRLRRIEENRKKLETLNLPAIGSPTDVKPKSKPVKRERIYEESPVPTRMSIRQRKKMKREAENDEEILKEYRRESRRIAKENKERANRLSRQRGLDKRLEIQVLAEERKQRVAEQLQQLDEAAEKEPRIQDWRLRRRRQAQLERRKETVKRREELKDERKLARKKKEAARKAWRASELLHKRRRKKRERFALNIQKEIEKQQMYEERQLMSAEDHQARKLVKKEKRDEKRERRLLKELRVKEGVVERRLLRSKVKEEKEEALFKKTYPVRRVKDLPFVRISDAREIDEAKPLVMTPLLKIDSNSFHAFSLGKQFLPPGKGAVMQGVCPGGYTAAFNEELDIHEWKNAMTLFMHGSSGIYYHFKFQEEKHDGRKSIFFQWSHTRNVTPEILERLRRVQKGDENLCFDDETYYDAPAPTGMRPEPLLLFVQYPMGPYIYLGRLGYLGHQSYPLKISFQLLDANVLNWKKIRKIITCETTAYESKRLQRMEENQRVLQSLNVPAIPRRPSRSKPVKTTVKLGPSRRSSRQKKRREIAEQQELESVIERQQEAAKQLALSQELELKKKQIVL
ncbi:hypothetical protein P3T76_005487 [Phytophthora citrophthora]|uniref:Uncharacterized protein n=1 Tax=Phytophthora citrophthora TaxID=4793 RepID=A0AAD9GQM4_9STRA|nr:hypothetical protein P3T76_005487 [Phytophthora citrophthora]